MPGEVLAQFAQLTAAPIFDAQLLADSFGKIADSIKAQRKLEHEIEAEEAFIEKKTSADATAARVENANKEKAAFQDRQGRERVANIHSGLNPDGTFPEGGVRPPTFDPDTARLFTALDAMKSDRLGQADKRTAEIKSFIRDIVGTAADDRLVSALTVAQLTGADTSKIMEQLKLSDEQRRKLKAEMEVRRKQANDLYRAAQEIDNKQADILGLTRDSAFEGLIRESILGAVAPPGTPAPTPPGATTIPDQERIDRAVKKAKGG